MMSYYTAKQELEQQLMHEIETEKKFSLRKLLKLIELNALVTA